MSTPQRVRLPFLPGLIALLALSVATCRLDMLLKPSVPDKPVLAVTPTQVRDSARAGSNEVRRANVEIKDGNGNNSFEWTASEGYPWIRLSPRDGTAPDTLTITLDPDGLAPGTYEGEVTVTASDVPDSLVTIAVTFMIQRARLVVAPTSVGQTTNVNSGAILSDTLRVANGGTGPLVWTATKSKPWLTLGNAAGSGPGMVPLTINSTGLAPGIHRDEVVVTAAGALGSPAKIPVTLTVFAPGLAVIPAFVRDSANLGSTTLRTDTLRVTNSGTGTLSWSAANSKPWVTLSKIAGGAPDDVVVTLNPMGLPPGTQQDTIVFSSPEATNGPVKVPVDFVIQQPCSEIPIVPDAVRAGVLNAADCEAPHRPGSLANLYSLTANAGDTLSIRLTAGFNAYLILTDGVGAVLAENDECLPETGTACIMGFPVTATGPYFIEATSAGAGETGPLTISVVRELPPSLPQALGQFRADSVTAIAIGAPTSEDAVVFQGSLNDPNPGDSVRLEVEVELLGSQFSGDATHRGELVSAGGGNVVARVRAGGLSNDAGFHWQARVCDRTGRCSAWVPFGENAETAADFRVELPPPPGGSTPDGFHSEEQARSEVNDD